MPELAPVLIWPFGENLNNKISIPLTVKNQWKNFVKNQLKCLIEIKGAPHPQRLKEPQ